MKYYYFITILIYSYKKYIKKRNLILIFMNHQISSENGIIFLDGSNPGKFSRKNYENLCYLLDTISAEVKIKNKKIRLKIEEE